MGNGVKLKEGRRVTRIRTKDSDSTATDTDARMRLAVLVITSVMAANGSVVGVSKAYTEGEIMVGTWLG